MPINPRTDWIRWAGFSCAVVFVGVLLGAHFLHPGADFPNFSPWMDYAKYTDEGWYGSAAVAYFIRGSWYVPGDFNPAVALPLWPFLEWILFHFTGVSLVAARLFTVAIFAGNLAVVYALVRVQAGRWTATLAALLIASNAFLYCFSRLAILEPPLILLMLLSWLAALALPLIASRPIRAGMLIAIGFLFCGMVLTKTTAIFLLPAIIYLVWFQQHSKGRAAWRSCGLITAAAGLLWLLYYAIAVKPHYIEDFRYLFAANVYTQPTTLSGWLMAFWYSLHGVFWIDRTLVMMAVALILLSMVWLRDLWRNPLFVTCCIAIAGYLFFIGYHNNMQPRYYQVVAFPLAILVVLAMRELWLQRSLWWRGAVVVATVAIAFSLVVNTRETLWFTAHPEYTFVDAARHVTRYIDDHPNRNRLLLSISGGDIALITGLPAICDDYGTLDLPERIRKYQPGWYAAWNELDPGTLEDLHTQFNLEQVASFPAYDDEDRNNLILYKLVPLQKETPAPRKRARRKQFGVGKTAAIRRVSEAARISQPRGESRLLP